MKLHPVMFVGTGSDVGKSVINAAFCRIFLQDGYRPAPFKAQNMAGILKCRFGGPNVYHGVLVEKPFIGEKQREITAKDIRRACAVNFAVATVVVVAIVLLRSYGA